MEESKHEPQSVDCDNLCKDANPNITVNAENHQSLSRCTEFEKYLGKGSDEIDQFKINSDYRETTVKGYCANKHYLDTHKNGGTRGKKRRNTKKRKNTKKRRYIKTKK